MTKNNSTLVFNRFRANSVGGRMAKLLSDGKVHSLAQVVRAAKPRSESNILQPGGWFALLRAYGRKSRKFNLSMTEDGKMVMAVRKGTVI